MFDGNIFMNKLLMNKWINRLFSRKCLVLPEEWISLKNSCRRTGKQGSEVNSKLVIIGGFKNCRFGKAVIIFQSKWHWHLSSVTSPSTLLHQSTLVQWKNIHFLENFITNTGLTSFLLFYSDTFVFLLILSFIALHPDCHCSRGWILFLWKTNHTWKG